jgi:membrane protein DedA with SNARE-associated domain
VTGNNPLTTRLGGTACQAAATRLLDRAAARVGGPGGLHADASAPRREPLDGRTRKREPAGLPGPVYSTLWRGGETPKVVVVSPCSHHCAPSARRWGLSFPSRGGQGAPLRQGGFATSGPEDVAERDYYRPVGSHEIQHLVHEYGCLLVFVAVGSQAVGLPVPGTTALIAAALYAATAHGLPIIGVIAAGALGALAGTSAGFAVGRWGGEGVLLRVGGRLRQSPERVQQLRRQFASHAVAWLFVGRFISGVRNATGLLAGASGMSLSRFLPVSMAAALTWALVNALEYYWFGHALLGASTWVQVVMVCAGIAWLVFSLNLLRRRTLRQLQRASSVTDLN